MFPTCLHHAHLFICEVWNRLDEEVRVRDEVCVEDGNEFTAGHGKTLFESSGLVALTVRAMDMLDIEAFRAEAFNEGKREVHCFIRGVIEKLDLELVLRIVNEANGLNKSVHHIQLVIERQLDGDDRQVFPRMGRGFVRNLLRLVIVVDHHQAMKTEGEEDTEREKVRTEKQIFHGVTRPKKVKRTERSGSVRSPVGDNGQKHVICDTSEGAFGCLPSSLCCICYIVDVEVLERPLPHHLVLDGIEVLRFYCHHDTTLVLKIPRLNRCDLILNPDEYRRETRVAIVFHQLNGVVAPEPANKRLRAELSEGRVTETASVNDRCNRHRLDMFRNRPATKGVTRGYERRKYNQSNRQK